MCTHFMLKQVIFYLYILCEVGASCTLFSKSQIGLDDTLQEQNVYSEKTAIRLWSLSQNSNLPWVIFVDGTDFSMGKKTLRIENQGETQGRVSFEQDLLDLLKSQSIIQSSKIDSLLLHVQILLIQFPYSAQKHPLLNAELLKSLTRKIQSKKCEIKGFVGFSQGGLLTSYALSHQADSLNQIQFFMAVDAPFQGAILPQSLMPFLISLEKISGVNQLKNLFCSQAIQEMVIQPNLKKWCLDQSLKTYRSSNEHEQQTFMQNFQIWPLEQDFKGEWPKHIHRIALSNGAIQPQDPQNLSQHLFAFNAWIGPYYWPKAHFNIDLDKFSMKMILSKPLQADVIESWKSPSLENNLEKWSGSTLRLPKKLFKNLKSGLQEMTSKKKWSFKLEESSQIDLESDVFIPSFSSADLQKDNRPFAMALPQDEYKSYQSTFDSVSYAPQMEYHVFGSGERFWKILREQVFKP